MEEKVRRVWLGDVGARHTTTENYLDWEKKSYMDALMFRLGYLYICKNNDNVQGHNIHL